MSVVAGSPLIEREPELAALRDALDAVAEERGGVVVVEGPAGIGKTSLVAAAVGMARERGLIVLGARGGELEREFSFGVARQLLERPVATASPQTRRALLAGAAGLAAPALGLVSPAGGPTGPPDRSFGEIHGLYWLLSNLAERERRPLVVAVDDAHCADVASLRLLVYVARRTAELPALVIVAWRRGEPDADETAIAALASEPGAVVLRPEPLSESGAERLLCERLGEEASAELATACHAETKGNPFLLTELIAELRAEGTSSAAGIATRVGELTPQAVSRSILLRLGRLPADAGALALALAVLGDGTSLRRAARLAGLDRAREAEGAAILARAEVIVDEDPLSFVHPLVRSTIYGDMAQPLRGSRHADAARLLAAEGEQPGRIAAHLLLVPPAADSWAVEVLTDAARTALAHGAASSAVGFLRRALIEPPPAREVGDLLAQLGTAELLGDDPSAAAGHLRQGVEMADTPLVRAQRAQVLAAAVAATEGVAAAVTVREQTINELGDSDRDLTLRLEAHLMSIGTIDPDLAPRLWTRAEHFVDLAGETPGERLVLGALAEWATCTGSRSAAQTAELAIRAARGGEVVRDSDCQDITWVSGVAGLVFTDEIDEAAVAIEEASRFSRERGWADGLAASRWLASLLALRGGDLLSAEQEANAGLELIDQLTPNPVRLALRTPLALSLIEIALERGKLDAGEDLLCAYEIDRELPDDIHSGSAHQFRALLRLAQDRCQEALADLDEQAAIARRAQINDPTRAWRSVAARVHSRLGDHEQAVRLADAQLQIARRWGLARDVGMALVTRAIVDARGARLDLLTEAASVLQASPARLEQARTLVELGSALRRARRRREAIEPLMRGADLSRACGATALTSRAIGELHILGSRPRRLAFSGPDSLTAAERRIATLAASGRTNQQIAQELFVTRKTVESHLQHVFRKLDVERRGQLASALTTNKSTGGERKEPHAR